MDKHTIADKVLDHAHYIDISPHGFNLNLDHVYNLNDGIPHAQRLFPKELNDHTHTLDFVGYRYV